MKATLFKEVNYTVNKLVDDVDLGEIGLPDIQRPFVWSNTKVRDLFDSMYRGFPVGHLLFWENLGSPAERQIGGGDKQQRIPRLLIVDGQQRITSLFSVIRGKPVVDEDYREKRIRLAFRPRDHQIEVTDAAVERNPEYLPDISALWAPDASVRRVTQGFLDRLGQYRELDGDEEDRLADALDDLANLLHYPFTAFELSSSVEEEEVAEVFVRVNSRGEQLNQADFVLTLLSVFWDKGRKQLEQFARDAKRPPESGGPSPHNYFIHPAPDQLLRVTVGLAFRRGRLKDIYPILRGRDPRTRSFDPEAREHNFAKLASAQDYALDLGNWHDYLRCIQRAGFRSGSMLSSKNNLIYGYVVYLIGRHDFGVDRDTLREAVARWFFMSAVTGRYTGSFETMADRDLARLSDASDAEDYLARMERIVADNLHDDFWAITLPNQLDTSSSRAPALFAYQAALNLLDARALFSRIRVADLLDPSVRGSKSGAERHHLFPKAYLKQIGIARTPEINQVANYAHVEWWDNIHIKDEPPASYWPKYAARLSADELAEAMRLHALPEGWHEMSYRGFLAARRELMGAVTREGFNQLIPQATPREDTVEHPVAEPDPDDDSGSDKTPQEDFERAVLQALVTLGGTAPAAAVIDEVGKLVGDQLKPGDYEPLASNPDQVRWRNATQWARYRLVQRGLMEPVRERGRWEISTRGRHELGQGEAPTSHSQEASSS